MKATAIAPANIAFIKYWGKADEELRLPLNTSISMNLSGAHTTTTVEFSDELKADDIRLVDGQFSETEKKRISKHLGRIRDRAKIRTFAKVVTQNSFPKSTGIASSASGFAALTVAGCASAVIALSEKELTVLARLGSGSACRSIPDGFVQWDAAGQSDDSYAHSLYAAEYWDIRDILVIVATEEKKVGSSGGMEGVHTSPHFAARLAVIPQRIRRLADALVKKDFTALGTVIEEDCLDMHRVMQTQSPPLNYWTEATKRIMEAVVGWRSMGLPVYYTIDAGPNVHLICETKDEERVVKSVKAMKGIKEVIVNRPAEGTHLVEEHLF